MATWQDLITRAYRLTGVLGEGEQMSGAQAEDGLLCLNELIDSWNSDNLNVYTNDIISIPVIGNKSTYSIGPAGDFDVPTRPPDINAAFFRLLTVTPYVDLPIYQISQLDWGNITSKGISGNLSQYFYYDGNFPLANIYVWPIPNGSQGEIILHVNHLLDSNCTLTGDASLPPAYAQAIRFNLAMLLCAENGLEPSVTVLNTAVRSKRLLEENNGGMEQRLSFDAGAMGSGTGRYMVQSDSIRK